MAVEAARDAVRGGAAVDTLLFATTSPPYAEKLNAATVQAALDLPEDDRARSSSVRRRAWDSRRCCSASTWPRPGARAGLRRRRRRRRARRRAREPERRRRRRRSSPAGQRSHRALARPGLGDDRDPRHLAAARGPLRQAVGGAVRADTMGPAIVDAAAARAAGRRRRAGDARHGHPRRHQPARHGRPAARRSASSPSSSPTRWRRSVGRTGAAHAGLMLARALDSAKPGDRILVVVGGRRRRCDAAAGHRRDRAYRRRRARSTAGSRPSATTWPTRATSSGAASCRPSRRAGPIPSGRPAPPIAAHERWKFAFVGSRCTACGTRPAAAAGRVREVPRRRQDADERFADTSRRSSRRSPSTAWRSRCSRRWWSAVVDFDGGGRFQSELTDVDPKKVAIGNQLEMTFRRLFTADGIHNYFWKARPARTLERRRSTKEATWRATESSDRVAIVGMGCTPSASTGTRASTTCSIEAAEAAYKSAGIEPDDVDAYWLGTMGSLSGLMLSEPLKIQYKPVTPRRELSARPAARRCATPPTPWRRAPTTA